ncbi:MAG: M48 family metallopeptidase [Proteobacteria bacterium]|nr:M48 family metallopeptidase [Pseudomonadota bacterium]
MKKITLLAIVSLSLSSCVTLPETGQKKLLLTSVSQENQMGEEGYKEVISKAKLANNLPAAKVLQRTGSRIAVVTGQSDFKWEYNLIDDKQLNAWCMPGGKIAVYTGILPFMKTEGGMAAVIGHEVAHATLRHSGQRMTQELGTQMVLGMAGASLANSPYQNQIMAAMGAGATVGVLLPYGRGHETEADTIGLKYMAEAGYDPREALSFWERFSAATSQGAPPEFLSTHPGGETRINNLKKNMKAMMKIYNQAPNKYGAGDNL